MFGRGKGKKAPKPTVEDVVETLQLEVERLTARLAGKEEQHRELVNEKAWWQDQVMQYANQIQFWQNKNREILDQLAKERGNVNLRKYITEVQDQIESAAPKAAEIAALIAYSKNGTQGLLPRGFEMNPPKRIEFKDVDDVWEE